MTVPVTVAWRDTARLGGRRAVSRAGFAIAAPMPAFVPSSSQCGGQLLLNQLFDEHPDPIPDSRLDRVGPSFPQKQRRLVRRRRAIRRHGVISAGATTPALRWLNEPEITLPTNSNHFPDGTTPADPE